MKFLAICICIVQICSESIDFSDDGKKELDKKIRGYIGGVSEQFVGDIIFAAEKFQNSDFVNRALFEGLVEHLSKILEHSNKSKIDVSDIEKREFVATDRLVESIEYLKTLDLILSKDLPPERYTGIMNLYYAMIYPNATADEIKIALDYLYGTGNTETIDLFRKVPDPIANDCPENFQRYLEVDKKLKSVGDINPAVFQDLTSIREKFPCDGRQIPTFVKDFVEMIDRLRTFGSTINACMVLQHSNAFKEYFYDKKRNGGRSIDKKLKDVEVILPARLEDDRFRGVVNFQKAIVLETPIDKIQEALEYVFVDVPKANCIENKIE